MFMRTYSRASQAFEVEPMAIEPAQVAFDRVLTEAGATRPRRDSVAARIVSQVKDNSGGIIDSQQQVGGWPALKSAAPTPDSDGDGMPDVWEQRMGLKVDDATDGSQDRDGDGYTNVEEYLNSL